MDRPANLETERLILLALLPQEIEALMAGDIELAGSFTGYIFLPGSQLGDLSWHLRALRSDSMQLPWRIRAIIERSSKIAVGSINLKGPPDAAGDVEMGWGLVESARNRGYATEAAAAVADWVIQQPGVRFISATVPDDNYPSQRIAQRLGLTRTNENRRNLPLWRRARMGIAGSSPTTV
jgi:[ribosomal protein S5]-alanine N-acetyltransferase